jgi:putative CocE/NonD family hydrolase
MRAWLVALLGCLAAQSAAAAGAAVDRGLKIVTAAIPMPDGVELAATLYMPADLRPGERVPALLEYLPYRKDDDTLTRDYGVHGYFAAHGYVSVRVDIRGFGRSGGAPPAREYSSIEQEDGERVIAWLARQSWSNGAVGMFGISWGGFNSIQLAMRRPPALKAILAVEATEALFTEDVHFMDGIAHVDEYELSMDLDQGRSGAPEFPIDEATLAARMDSAPWSLDYLRHQRDGAFWRAPVRPLEDIRIPCFLIAGLQDGYRDSVLRMLERVHAPVTAWVGPWNHDYPNTSVYGPRVEWRDRAVRWFDHWLKGIANGVDRDPSLVYYLQHSHPPGAQPQDVPGEWRAAAWPIAGAQPLTWFLAPNHALAAAPGSSSIDRLRYAPSAGAEAGFWWGELLADQRPVDAFSLVYDTPPLATAVAIFGRPEVRLLASVDAPLANWYARLEDVAPDGQVTAVTGAALSGAQRRSTAEPQALVPGVDYPFAIRLHLGSWVFPAGHRIRLAVSNALWPMMWPTPFPMTAQLRLGGDQGSRLELPQVPARATAAAPFAPPAPVATAPGTSDDDFAWPGVWTLQRDEASGQARVTWRGKSALRFPWGSFDHHETLLYDVDDGHPELASVDGQVDTIQTLGSQVLTYRGHLHVSSDATTFYYEYTRELLRNDVLVHSRSWREAIPRDLQ